MQVSLRHLLNYTRIGKHLGGKLPGTRCPTGPFIVHRTDARFLPVPAEEAAFVGLRVQHKGDVPDLGEEILVNKLVHAG